MSLHRIQLIVGLLCLLASATSASAQARGYHLMLSSGANGNVVVFNDSDKPIEAFHVNAMCVTPGWASEGMTSTYDALLTPQKTAPLVVVAGWQNQSQSDVLAPHSRMVTSISVPPDPSGCIWKTTIDGIIFSDGTYSGTPEVVQSMQAWRDGVAASLQYWANRLRASGFFQPINVQDEAKKRSQEDQSSHLAPDSAGGQYWMGRMQVDQDLALITPAPGAHWLEELFLRQYPSQMVNRWQAKLDSDAAFRKLNAIFPLRAEMLQPPPPRPISAPCKPNAHK